MTITNGFWLGQTEVTQAAYERVMGRNPSHFKGANLPVETISWDEAQTYCKAIGGRLPSEAEWEYAARAGTTQGQYGDIMQIAWYDRNSGRKTHDVAQKEANAWGLYDMPGNVSEWTSDYYTGYQSGSASDPKGPASGQERTVRGGSYGFNSRTTRVSFRASNAPGNSGYVIGVRCAGE